MTGRHRHAARILTKQIEQAPPDLRCGVAVVDQRQDALWVLPPDTDEIGDAVHENTRLAGARTGQHEDTRLLPVVGHDPGLVGVAQGFHDRTPGFGRRLAAQRGSAAGQPLLHKRLPFEREIVVHQTRRIAHRDQAALRVGRHDVGLERLLVIVDVQRPEVGLGELPTARLETDRDRRTEDGEPSAQRYRPLLVQPEEGVVEKA